MKNITFKKFKSASKWLLDYTHMTTFSKLKFHVKSVFNYIEFKKKFNNETIVKGGKDIC